MVGKGQKSDQLGDISATDDSETSEDANQQNHQPNTDKEMEPRRTSAPRIPPRRMSIDDKLLMKMNTWSNVADLKLEDPVTVPDATHIALQGVVAYVGDVQFADGIWVGVQLTGPSVGKGNCDGAWKGTRYFSKVGRKNGVMAPIGDVRKRDMVGSSSAIKEGETGEQDQKRRQTPEAQIAAVKYVETLKKERATAILKKSDADEKRRWIKTDTEEIYIKRLKEQRLDELRWSRSKPQEGTVDDIDIGTKKTRKPRFGGINSRLCRADYELVVSLQEADLGFVITDPLLPDNPVTFASQQFLRTTGHTLNEILGQNCRFLQGPETDQKTVEKIRKSIMEGSDCSVKILNYRADKTTFWNQFFITALRDSRGRVKNYIGCQCEISPDAFLAEYKASRPRSKSRATKSSLRAKSESKFGDKSESNSGNGQGGHKVKFEESVLASSGGNMRPSRSMPDLQNLAQDDPAEAPTPTQSVGSDDTFRMHEQRPGAIPMPFYPPYYPGGPQWFIPGYPPYPGPYPMQPGMMQPAPMHASASTVSGDDQLSYPPQPVHYAMPQSSFLSPAPGMPTDNDTEPEFLNMNGMYMGPQYVTPPAQQHTYPSTVSMQDPTRGRRNRDSTADSRGSGNRRRSRSKSLERRRSSTPAPGLHSVEDMFSPRPDEIQYIPKERKSKKKGKVKKERRSKPRDYLVDSGDTTKPEPPVYAGTSPGIIQTEIASTLDDELSKIVCLVQSELSKIEEVDENFDESLHPKPE